MPRLSVPPKTKRSDFYRRASSSTSSKSSICPMWEDSGKSDPSDERLVQMGHQSRRKHLHPFMLFPARINDFNWNSNAGRRHFHEVFCHHTFGPNSLLEDLISVRLLGFFTRQSTFALFERFKLFTILSPVHKTMHMFSPVIVTIICLEEGLWNARNQKLTCHVETAGWQCHKR